MELSSKTIYNDGGVHVVNDESTSFNHESIIVTNDSTLRLEANGYINSPDNSDGWPTVRLSIGAVFNGTGGSVTGSLATGDNTDGGEAIEMYNGQYSPKTASFGYFYDGINVIGGDAPIGVGGNALHVHGFGTEAFIYGGNFAGGKGSNYDDGLSIYALNAGKVHIYSGSFQGDIEVGDSSIVAFYGCFLKDGPKVTGFFVDDTNLEVNVRLRNGGSVELISVSEQECETQPSAAPTNFPTSSPQPTVPRPNSGNKTGVSLRFILAAITCMVNSHLMV